MHYIVYHDRTHEAVEDKVADIIWDKSSSGMKGVEVNGKKYLFSSMAKILEEKDYFEQYPDKRPQEEYNQFEDLYGKVGSQQVRKPAPHARVLLLEGIKKYIDENPNKGELAKKLYNEYATK